MYIHCVIYIAYKSLSVFISACTETIWPNTSNDHHTSQRSLLPYYRRKSRMSVTKRAPSTPSVKPTDIGSYRRGRRGSGSPTVEYSHAWRVGEGSSRCGGVLLHSCSVAAKCLCWQTFPLWPRATVPKLWFTKSSEIRDNLQYICRGKWMVHLFTEAIIPVTACSYAVYVHVYIILLVCYWY
jgi:hypothetical protein